MPNPVLPEPYLLAPGFDIEIGEPANVHDNWEYNHSGIHYLTNTLIDGESRTGLQVRVYNATGWGRDVDINLTAENEDVSFQSASIGLYGNYATHNDLFLSVDPRTSRFGQDLGNVNAGQRLSPNALDTHELHFDGAAGPAQRVDNFRRQLSPPPNLVIRTSGDRNIHLLDISFSYVIEDLLALQGLAAPIKLSVNGQDIVELNVEQLGISEQLPELDEMVVDLDNFSGAADLLNGILRQDVQLFQSAGPGVPLGLILHYSSYNSQHYKGAARESQDQASYWAPFGQGWTWNLGARVLGKAPERTDVTTGDAEHNIRLVMDPLGRISAFNRVGQTNTFKTSDLGYWQRWFERPDIDMVLVDHGAGFELRGENETDVWLFDSEGRLIEVKIPRYGRPLRIAWSAGQALITDSSGRVAQMTFTGDLVTSVAGPGGETWSFIYDGPSLVQIDGPDGTLRRFAYDGDHFMMIQSENGLGGVSDYSYLNGDKTNERTRWGTLTEARLTGSDILDEVHRFAYTNNADASTGFRLAYTAPSGAITSYTITRGSFQRRVEIVAHGAAGSMTYDRHWRLTEMRDAMGQPTTINYDLPSDLPEVVMTPGGGRRSFRDIGTGPEEIGRTVDALGNRIHYEYVSTGGAHGLLSKMTHSEPFSGAMKFTAEYDYVGAGDLAEERESNGELSSFAYANVPGYLGMPTRLVRCANSGVDEVDEKEFEYTPYGWLSKYTAEELETRWRRNPLGDILRIDEAEAGEASWTENDYNAQGLKTGVRDSLGNHVVMTYDAAGRLKSETSRDAVGVSHVVEYKYDASGNVLEVKGPAGPVVMTNTQRGQVETITYPDGIKVAFAYNPRGDLVREIREDANGNLEQTDNDVDDAGRVIKIIHAELALPDGSGGTWRPTVEFTYFADGQVESIRQELEPGRFSRKTFELDGMGRPFLAKVDIENEGTYERRQDLDETGRVNISVGPTFRFTGPTSTRPIVINAEDMRNPFLRRFSHDCRDRVTQIRNGNGALAEYEYNAADQIRRIQVSNPRASSGMPLAEFQTREYDSDGKLQRVHEPGGYVTEFEYDPATGENAATETGGPRHASRLSTNGLVANKSTSAIGLPGVETDIEYNTEGNITRMVHRNELPSGQEEFQEHVFSYGPDGRLNKRTDALQREYSLGRDGFGRQTSAQSGGESIQYVRDAFDRVTEKVITPSGETSRFAYDGHSNMTFADNDVATCRWAFDTVGRIVSREVHFKVHNVTKRIDYQYDEFGMLVRKEDNDDSRIRYSYDDEERLVGVFLNDESEGIIEHNYYGWGGISQIILKRGGFRSRYEYGHGGKINTIIHGILASFGAASPDYSRLEYTRSSDRRVTQLSRSGRFQQDMTFFYDGMGRLRQQVASLPNSELEEHYVWDGVGNLRAFTRDGVRGKADFDLANQIETWDESTVNFVDGSGISVNTSTDAAGHSANVIVDNDFSDSSDPASAWRSEAFDTDHSVTLTLQSVTRISGIEVWVPSALGAAQGLEIEYQDAGGAWQKLPAAEVVGGAYGADGLDISRRRARLIFAPVESGAVRITRPAGKGFTQTQDPDDRVSFLLIEVRLLVIGGNSISFEHDQFGAMTRKGSWHYEHDIEGRLRRIVGPGTDIERQFGPDGRLAVSIDHISGETTLHVSDGITAYGEYSSDGTPLRRYVSAPFKTVPFGFAEGAGKLSDQQMHFLLTDERNSVVNVVLDTNLLENTYAYDALGRQIHMDETVKQPFGFMGARRIGDTGLYDFGQRVYDPQLGRFIERDMVAGGPNAYAAFKCDPVNREDPLGASVGDYWDSIVATAKEFPGVLYEDFASGAAAQRLRSFGKGFVEGTVAAVEGSIHAITHPIETIEGIGTAIVNYDQVFEAFEQQWDQLMWQAAHDPQAFAESVGRFIGELEAGMVMGAGADKLKAMARIGDMAAGLQRRCRMFRNSTAQSRQLPNQKPDQVKAQSPVDADAPAIAAAKGGKPKRKRKSRKVPKEHKEKATLWLPRGNFRKAIREKYKVSDGWQRRHIISDRSTRGILSRIARETDDPVAIFRDMNKARGYADFPENIGVYQAARKLQLNIFNDPRHFWRGPGEMNEHLGRLVGREAKVKGGVNLVDGPTFDLPPGWAGEFTDAYT